jgi:uncharacterized membrane protein
MFELIVGAATFVVGSLVFYITGVIMDLSGFFEVPDDEYPFAGFVLWLLMIFMLGGFWCTGYGLIHLIENVFN